MKYPFRRLIATLAIAWNIGFVITHWGAPVIVTKTEVVAMTKPKAEDVAKQLLTSKAFKCWHKLALLETSTIDPFAKNPRSSARGVGQLLSSTYDNLGMKHTNDEVSQVVAMLAYIGRKYGSGGPCAAYQFHLKHGYY